MLTTGGILETKKIGDLALEQGVAMAVHMAESPIGCMAAVHSVAASENFLALDTTRSTCRGGMISPLGCPSRW